ncbi:MAG: hypothetical protein PHU46_08940 [Rhodocyclaceae bacterium]|nr:hypothetical protein [Rhodocyclaceae bacterium]
MSHTVIVSFGSNREYEFRFAGDEVAGTSRDIARRWLHEQFDALECEPRNPMGKMLLLDMILDVAKYSGEKHFMEKDDWAQTYAQNVAAVLDRPAARVDVENLKVG